MKRIPDLLKDLRGLIKIVNYSDVQIQWASTGNPYCGLVKDVGIDGYTPLGFGYTVTGTGASFVYPSIKMLDNNGTLTLALRMVNNNPSSVTQNKVNLRVVYVKSGILGGGYGLTSLLLSLSERWWKHEERTEHSAATGILRGYYTYENQRLHNIVEWLFRAYRTLECDQMREAHAGNIQIIEECRMERGSDSKYWNNSKRIPSCNKFDGAVRHSGRNMRGRRERVLKTNCGDYGKCDTTSYASYDTCIAEALPEGGVAA